MDLGNVTETVTDYVHFSVDNMIQKMVVTVFSNNKPNITEAVKESINLKKWLLKVETK